MANEMRRDAASTQEIQEYLALRDLPVAHPVVGALGMGLDSPTFRAVQGMLYLEELKDALAGSELNLANIMKNAEARDTLQEMMDKGLFPTTLDPDGTIVNELLPGAPRAVRGLLYLNKDLYDLNRVEAILNQVRRGSSARGAETGDARIGGKGIGGESVGGSSAKGARKSPGSS